MNKLAALVAAPLLIVSLAACSAVSGEERAACEQSGGWVESKDFHYQGNSFWSSEDTGEVEYCERDGKIVEVYNEEVQELDYGMFGDDEDNRRVFYGCGKLDGRTYRTEELVGKVTYTRFVCVQGGEVVQILK